MRLLNLKLMFDETIHPEDMIVLSFKFELITNQET
jgi:hypothetical protein